MPACAVGNLVHIGHRSKKRQCLSPGWVSKKRERLSSQAKEAKGVVYQCNTDSVVIPSGDVTFHPNIHAQKDEVGADCKRYQGDGRDGHASKIAILGGRRWGCHVFDACEWSSDGKSSEEATRQRGIGRREGMVPPLMVTNEDVAHTLALLT